MKRISILLMLVAISTLSYSQLVKEVKCADLKAEILKDYSASYPFEGIWEWTSKLVTKADYGSGLKTNQIDTYVSHFVIIRNKNYKSYYDVFRAFLPMMACRNEDGAIELKTTYQKFKIRTTSEPNVIIGSVVMSGVTREGRASMNTAGYFEIKFEWREKLKNGNISQETMTYYMTKLYPTKSDILEYNQKNASVSGTGFAISSNGIIVTNTHVVNGSENIKVRGVKGDFSKTYTATILSEDKQNDLAILKITDPKFTTLGVLPYTIKNTTSVVGTDVYALGYPLRATMGDEVKLTNGIISSKTGFQGDVTSYQISVPIQPGNSGGPLYDSKGNVIGIINAKHTGTDNVSYAIKSSYLFNLIQVLDDPISLPKSNTISAKNLAEQVKYVKEFVYIIEVN